MVRVLILVIMWCLLGYSEGCRLGLKDRLVFLLCMCCISLWDSL